MPYRRRLITTRIGRCARTRGCLGGSSATPCASSRGSGSSTSLKRSARPRYGSVATRTRPRGANSARSWIGCRAPRRARSSAPSATSRTSPTSPRTSTGSAAPGPMRSPACRRVTARWRRRWRAPATPALPAISPVLTAHPTEVRRKSMIDREMEVANLLAERDRPDLTPEELAANEEGLRRAVLTLWQTSLLRRTRLRVIDEVAGGGERSLPSFLRMGSWIGGDRDGNPFVDADVLRQALGMQSSRAFGFYLEELRLLGTELSLDSRLVSVSNALRSEE